MRFIVDAQLPITLCDILANPDHEITHVLELANKDKNTDKEICYIANNERIIATSKDTDFYYSIRP